MITLNLQKIKLTGEILVAFLLFSLFQGCSSVPVQPSGPPFGPEEIGCILSNFGKQRERVQSAFSSGRLTVRTNGSEYDANILIVGTKNPLRTKIEITHPWGRPLLHILIRDARLHLLSFTEKEYYIGNIGVSDPSKFFPIPLDLDHIWTLVRSYPVLYDSNRAVSYEKNQIMLLNEKGELVQVIHLYPQTDLPSMVSYPKQGIKISFADFQNEDGIQHAKKIRLEYPDNDTTLRLHLKHIAFDKKVPTSIFQITIPAGFKMLSLPCTQP